VPSDVFSIWKPLKLVDLWFWEPGEVGVTEGAGVVEGLAGMVDGPA
jgi:hypothetical protein